MDGRGGCCIARYAHGDAYDMSKVNMIMLRFRPIAPKPVNGGSVSGGSMPENMTEVLVRGGGRRKRRYARDNNNSVKRCNNRKRKAPPEQKKRGVSSETVVTLPLLPESPEPKDSPDGRNPATGLSFENFAGNNNIGEYHCNDKVREVMPRGRTVRVVGSCVTVDCVTDTWVDGDGLGCTDVERRMNLERDTCPGFVSDGVGRVVWTNGAYRNMVGQGGGDEMMAVLLVMKEMRGADLVPAAFTCRVRVQYYNACSSGTTSLKSKDSWSSLTLPCDVWRMEGGGFAWRLDVKAALCLGRYGTKAV